MRRRLLNVLVAASCLTGLARAAPALARPDFWEVSAQAAANAGLDSPIAPIILGNTYALASQQDPDGVRASLTRVQLMLAYVAVDQYDLYKRVFGAPNLHIDAGKFDASFKDYLPSLGTLQGNAYDRWLDPHPQDKGVRLEGLSYAARHFAEIEVALRRKIATDDRMGLADAISKQGLVFRHLGDTKQAASDYEQALTIFAEARRERSAIESVDRAFSVGDVPAPAGTGTAASGLAAENFTVSSDEPFIVSTVIQATDSDADDAIKDGRKEEAQKDIDLMGSARYQGDRIDLYMNLSWPCHQELAPAHYWRAVLAWTRWSFARKFQPDSPDEARKYFNQASDAFQRAAEISLFSEGATPRFAAITDSYVAFLKETDNAEQAGRIAAGVASFKPSEIGIGGPPSWRAVLDCQRVAR